MVLTFVLGVEKQKISVLYVSKVNLILMSLYLRIYSNICTKIYLSIYIFLEVIIYELQFLPTLLLSRIAAVLSNIFYVVL